MTTEDFTDLESAWDSFEPRDASGFGPTLPDGQHQAMLSDIKLTVRQSDDHRQLYLKFQNRAGSIRAWRDLENDIGLNIALNDLVLLGFEIPDSGRWAAVQESIDRGDFTNLVCNIGVRTKPGDTRDFTDVFLNGVIGPADDPGLFAVTAASGQPSADADFQGSDDDIPF